MFNFRIIYYADGTDVIDTTLKTPYSSLTPAQMEDYIETDKRLAYMEQMKKKECKKMEHKQKVERNPIWRFFNFCGIA